MKNYWNDQYQAQDPLWGLDPSLAARLAAFNITIPTDGNVLDFGCGYGRDTFFFVRRGLEVIGVDSSAEAILRARQIQSELSDSNYRAQFMVGDCGQISITSIGQVNLVYSNYTIHLLRDDERESFIKNVKPILKPCGRLAISLMSDQDEDFGKGNRLADGTFQRTDGKIQHFFSEAEARSMIIASGLRLELLELHMEYEVLYYNNCRVRKTPFWFAVAQKGE
jgi:SAM-dependent methyltransferase